NWLCHQLKQRYSPLHKRLQAFCVPEWAQLAALAQRAHTLVQDIRVVAWDFVVTPTGPVLLEGNSGWGLTVPQILNGPLLPRWPGLHFPAIGQDAAACAQS
ncbi:MAG TPA: sugar-transfer associated ATP-grasp domain-containing protein, partial [Pseudomonadales bacterium]|nr:sugar-transfer associated ATP-grasp domain-containing protein [Pseudomonadales bacterium]